MRTARWLLAVPVGFLASLVTWAMITSFSRTVYYGGGFVRSAIGLLPIILAASVPSALYVISAGFVCPSRHRRMPFVFFAVAVLTSAGGMEAVLAYESGTLPFWITAAASVVFGAVLGLAISLRFQARASGVPNQAPETTRGTKS